ncbi:MAG: hypothetical protein GTN78_21470 [Gemmatimonadales bacterium]|nr:hypothetical protein [Gemmatimonadales bacterium]
MTELPRTDVGGIPVPRLICGSNWIWGCSHYSAAKDRLIKDLFDTPSKVADVLEVFAGHGCNAFLSGPDEFLAQALRETEQRTGVEMLWIATPWSDPETPDPSEAWRRAADRTKELGAQFCLPHGAETDVLLDRANQRLMPQLVENLKYARSIGLVPGLSTHTPQAILCADSSDEGLVETYLQPYNSAGFLCESETEWIQEVIANARKPVICIKPLAAGRLMPPTGLNFVWNTIRDCDMVCLGVMSKYEAEESIELSLSILGKRRANVSLQETRSKRVLTRKRS